MIIIEGKKGKFQQNGYEIYVGHFKYSKEIEMEWTIYVGLMLDINMEDIGFSIGLMITYLFIYSEFKYLASVLCY